MLDLSDKVRSTASMLFSVTHAMCQRIDSFDVKKHIQYMARQRCVGANGDRTD